MIRNLICPVKDHIAKTYTGNVCLSSQKSSLPTLPNLLGLNSQQQTLPGIQKASHTARSEITVL